MKKIILSEQAPSPIGPYSQAVSYDNMLYLSGQIALDTDGNLINASIEEETDKVMQNINEVLKVAGSEFSKVIKCTIFVKDMDNFQKINAVYGKYFSNNPPARETVEVSRLPKDVNVEISCIAYIDSK